MRIILSDQAKRGLEGGAWIDGYDYQNKDKTLPLQKIRVRYFFCAVYHSKTHVISNPVIAAILDVILNILQHLKQYQHSSQIPQIRRLLKTSENSY